MRVYWIWVVMIGLLLSGCIPPVSAAEAPGSGFQSLPTQPPALLGRYTTPPAGPALPTASPALPPTHVPQSEAERFPPDWTALAPTVDPSTPTASPTVSPLDGFQICVPVAEILLADLPQLISDGYHPPPVARSDARHPGIDIAFFNWKGYHQIAGAPVQSVLPGRVAAAEVDTFPFGNVLIVETQAEQLPAAVRQALDMPAEQSLYLLYAHMEADSLRVTRGEIVTPCQTLGRVGRTGNSGQAHLHLETRLGAPGATFAGLAYYTATASAAEKENYKRWSTSGEFRHFDPLRLLLYEFGYQPTPTPPKDRWSD